MTPVNNILLEIDSALQHKIVAGTLELEIIPEWNPEQYATVTGKIIALPTHPRGDNADIVKDLEVGDNVAFLYSVCSRLGYKNDSMNFHPATEGSDYLRIWYNSKGHKITVMALPGILTKRWIATYNNERNELLSGVDGKESDVDRWLSQFTFGSGSELYFKNLVEIDGKKYWKADYREILAVKRGDEVIAMGDWVCCNPIFIDQTEAYNLANGLVMPPMSVGFVLTDRAQVVNAKNFEKGQVIAGADRFWNEYDLWGEKFYFIKERRVHGVHEEV